MSVLKLLKLTLFGVSILVCRVDSSSNSWYENGEWRYIGGTIGHTRFSFRPNQRK